MSYPPQQWPGGQPGPSGPYPGQPVGPPPGYPHMSVPPAYGGAPPGQPPVPPKRSRRGCWIAGLGCGGLTILALAGVVGLVFAFAPPLAGNTSSDIFEAGSGFTPGAPITEEALAETDPDTIFWTMFANQAKKPVVQFNSQYFSSERDYETEEGFSFGQVDQSRVDYREQRITSGTTDYEKDDSGRQVVDGGERCVGETQYRERDGEWQENELSGISCTTRGQRIVAGDGIAPGGLNDEQVQKYISFVQTEYEGNPVSAGKPELVDHQGKKYVKLPVKVTPVRHEFGYSGMMIFLWANNRTGRPASTHLYTDFGAGGSGADLVYYIDPDTTLPAYMEIRERPGKNKDGSPDAYGDSMRRVQYEFPDQWRPYSIDNPEDLKPFTIDWGKTVP